MGEAPVGGPGPRGKANDPRGSLGSREPASTWLTNDEQDERQRGGQTYLVGRLSNARILVVPTEQKGPPERAES